MEISGYFTLATKAGYFIFPVGTVLNHAKLIRDTISASFFGAFLGAPQVKASEPEKAPLWIRDYLGGPVGKANISFQWVPK